MSSLSCRKNEKKKIREGRSRRERREKPRILCESLPGRAVKQDEEAVATENLHIFDDPFALFLLLFSTTPTTFLLGMWIENDSSSNVEPWKQRGEFIFPLFSSHLTSDQKR